MQKFLALGIILLLFVFVTGCFFDGAPTMEGAINSLRSNLIAGNASAISDLFKYPCTIEADIFGCDEEEEFRYRTQLRDHFSDLFDEVDFIDITITGQTSVTTGEDTGRITAIWYITGEEGEEGFDTTWDATFDLVREGVASWKITSIVFEPGEE